MIDMKRILLTAAAVALTSCQLIFNVNEIGNGISVQTPIEVSEFNSISSRCSLDIYYTQSDKDQSVLLTCDENLVDLFDIRVEEGVLIVDTKGGGYSTKIKIYATITSPKLSSLKLSGSGDCNITGPITTDGDFSFKVSGSGDIDADGAVICKNFSSSVSGSGDIEVAGVQAQTADFKDSGSGDIEVDSLTAEDISVRMSGSGDITLKCKDAGYIDASLSGSGDLNLSGTARSIKSNTTGSGNVKSGNLTIIRQ